MEKISEKLVYLLFITLLMNSAYSMQKHNSKSGPALEEELGLILADSIAHNAGIPKFGNEEHMTSQELIKLAQEEADYIVQHATTLEMRVQGYLQQATIAENTDLRKAKALYRGVTDIAARYNYANKYHYYFAHLKLGDLYTVKKLYQSARIHYSFAYNGRYEKDTRSPNIAQMAFVQLKRLKKKAS